MYLANQFRFQMRPVSWLDEILMCVSETEIPSYTFHLSARIGSRISRLLLLKANSYSCMPTLVVTVACVISRGKKIPPAWIGLAFACSKSNQNILSTCFIWNKVFFHLLNTASIKAFNPKYLAFMQIVFDLKNIFCL